MRNPPLIAALRADIAAFSAVKRDSDPTKSGVLDVVTLPGFWCATLWRFSNTCYERGLRPLSRLSYFANMVLFGADLAPGSVVGPGLVMPHPVGVAVARGTTLGSGCRMMAKVTIGGSGRPDRPGHPVIGDDVWLLDNARLFGPITVGDGSVIGAGAMVVEDVPAGVTALIERTPLKIRPRKPTAA